ncbi:MAG: hypothetical protein ACI4U5_02705 [Bacilli bacterium]
MPKKPKFTKEEVIKAGYKIIKEKGSNHLTARYLSASLNCAISPIFTLFSCMEEVKEEIYQYVKNEFMSLMKESENYFPMFKQYGLLFISYCKDNPTLFTFLFSRAKGDVNQIIREEKDFYELLENNICEVFSLQKKEAHELVLKMMMIAIGLAINIISNDETVSLEKIGSYFSEICIGLVLEVKAKKGELDKETACFLSKHTNVMPKKIK